ncbi:MAG TPA: 3-isopropylmalate dehydratase small subunit, partial [Planctomycetota bacterium]|nr:3-isopropylmalate dehydratase small subunit [Planctomycetota bacterium]
MMEGTARKFGDDVNTDEIIPARYLNTTDPDELARHCMEDADPQFMQKAKPGDFIVAGENFGCGSSREHAPIAIKGAKIAAVIAKSYARIFYRNAINTGLVIIESQAAADDIADGDHIRVDLTAGSIENVTKQRKYKALPFPPEMQEIINAGG